MTQPLNASDERALAKEFACIQNAGNQTTVDVGVWTEEELFLELVSSQSQRFLWQQPMKGFVLYRYTEPEIWIMHLAVKDKGQGQGSAMLADFFATIKERHPQASEVGLEVSHRNLLGVALYLKFGFVQVALRKAYYRNGDDAIIMKKALRR